VIYDTIEIQPEPADNIIVGTPPAGEVSIEEGIDSSFTGSEATDHAGGEEEEEDSLESDDGDISEMRPSD